MRAVLISLGRWMAGKKTYLLASVVAVGTLTLVFLQRLTPTTASAVALLAVSGFAATYRDALKRHQAEVVAILIDTATAGKAAATHNRTALIASAEQVVQKSTALADELKTEQQAQMSAVQQKEQTL